MLLSLPKSVFYIMVLCMFLNSKVQIQAWKSLRWRKLSTRLSSTTTKDPFFITTPIYYVNGDPHLGHAYTSVVSDVIARFHRKDGREVFFLTGTDEHGQKVEQSALKCKRPTLDFATDVSQKFRNLLSALNCSNDEFIRTTDHKHKESVKELWKKLESNGQIYLGSYEGWYCVRDECFYPQADLVNGKAPTGADVEWVKEESYFFRLSNYTERLLKLYEDEPNFIAPKGRRSEVISFVGQEGGLRDLSISRTTFMWGIPVPGNKDHVMYVWLDALANYISALDYPNVEGEKFRKFWPAALHIVGKDILRFHAVYWPAFLMAADLPVPKKLFAHGWWTRDGEKMSKSVGNVIDPFDLIKQYSADYVRYYMTSEIHLGNDGDFTHEVFCQRINTDLANDLGNLVMRVAVMIERHCDSRIPAPPSGESLRAEDEVVLQTAKGQLDKLRELITDKQEVKQMCMQIISVSKLGNKYFDTEAPWVLAKTDLGRLQTVLFVLVELLRCCGIYLEPVIPLSSKRLLDQLNIPDEMRTFDSLQANPLDVVGRIIPKPTPLFPRVIASSEQCPPPAPVAATAKGDKGQKARVAASISCELAKEYDLMNQSQLERKILEVGSRLKELKADGLAKADLKPHIDELMYLKNRLERVCAPKTI